MSKHMKTLLFISLLAAQPGIMHSAPRLHTPGPALEYKKQAPIKKGFIRKKMRKVIPISVKVYSARSLTVDLLVTCQKNKVMITFSRAERKFCTPKMKCHKKLSRAILPYCK